MSPRDTMSHPRNKSKHLAFIAGISRREWYDSEDRLHRRNGPAAEWSDGRKAWFMHGELRFLEDSNGRIRRTREELLAMRSSTDLTRSNLPGYVGSFGSPAYAGRKKVDFVLLHVRHRVWVDKTGSFHRAHGPASEGDDGSKHWFWHGVSQFHLELEGPWWDSWGWRPGE